MNDHTTRHSPQEIPYGYCHCGCGQKTALARRNDPAKGWVKGQPLRFIQGHFATTPIEDRFWPRVDKRGPDECWLWLGSVNAKGYGRLGRRDSADRYAHRISYRIHFGSIPDGLIVMHRCDTPGCVNPNHLFLGTYSDNVQDMIAKGRQNLDRVRGDASKAAKLSEADVVRIRQRLANGASAIHLAREYSVNRETIRCIKNRTSWAHVP